MTVYKLLKAILPLSHFGRVLVRKQVKLILYGLAHGVSCVIMHNLYGCGEFTIRKYTMIVCRALGSGDDGLFFQFIHTPSGYRLQNTIEKFESS